MRVSGSAHADGGRVGSAVQLWRPVAPVVSRGRSSISRAGEMVWSSAVEKVAASKGATVSTGSFRNWLSVRSEEHTSELQSHLNLVCRLLLEKKKKNRST